MTKTKPQTPREIIAKLAAMPPDEFNRFMHDHFLRLCRKRLPDDDENTQTSR